MPTIGENALTVKISNRDRVTTRKCKHGSSFKKLYFIWRAMRSRCYFPSDKNYKRYGARGITVCDEWRDEYKPFEAWALANGYREGLSIDRKNNDDPYCANNCQWISRGDNSRKRSSDWAETGRTPVPVEVIVAIRDEAANGATRASLSEKYNLPLYTVTSLIARRSYKSVGGSPPPSPRRKLTREKVFEIFKLHKAGDPMVRIVETIGVSRSIIDRVLGRPGPLPPYVLDIISSLRDDGLLT